MCGRQRSRRREQSGITGSGEGGRDLQTSDERDDEDNSLTAVNRNGKETEGNTWTENMGTCIEGEAEHMTE